MEIEPWIYQGYTEEEKNLALRNAHIAYEELKIPKSDRTLLKKPHAVTPHLSGDPHVEKVLIAEKLKPALIVEKKKSVEVEVSSKPTPSLKRKAEIDEREKNVQSITNLFATANNGVEKEKVVKKVKPVPPAEVAAPPVPIKAKSKAPSANPTPRSTTANRVEKPVASAKLKNTDMLGLGF